MALLMPPPHAVDDCFPTKVSVFEVRAAIYIKSFRRVSAGGPDSLRPQHVLNSTSGAPGNYGHSLLSLLTVLINRVLADGVPNDFQKAHFWSGSHRFKSIR